MTAVTLSPVRRRAIRDGLLVAGLLLNALNVFVWGPSLVLFADTLGWRQMNLADLYGPAEAFLALPSHHDAGAFLWSPAAAYAFLPLTWLPEPGPILAFLAIDLAALAVLGRRWALILLVAFPPVLLELENGNIHLLLALAIWAGLRWPAAWAFVLLTKVTPGIGLIWFAARREWRNLAVAIGLTAAIAAVSFVLTPGLWFDWIQYLQHASAAPPATILPPLLVRLPIAAAVAWYAGRTDRAWLIPVAALIAMPSIWIQSLAMLTACFPLWWDRARWSRATERTTASADLVPPAKAERVPATGAEAT